MCVKSCAGVQVLYFSVWSLLIGNWSGIVRVLEMRR